MKGIIREILRHELGHIIAARKIGIPTGEIVLYKHSYGAGIDFKPKFSSLKELQVVCWNRMLIKASGPIAQLINQGNISNNLWNNIWNNRSTAQNDFKEFEVLLKIYVGAKYDNLQKYNDILATEGKEVLSEALYMIASMEDVLDDALNTLIAKEQEYIAKGKISASAIHEALHNIKE